MSEHTISQESSAVMAELSTVREMSQSYNDSHNDNA